jgi:spore coat polysaccharide biosynthesis protein SpsF
LRAANQNHATIVATSDDSSDDELVQEAQAHGLAIFRGPLHDVLARYYLASIDLPDDSVVIRLTADNVVPDGQFVQELTQAFASAKADYVSADAWASGLPYGLGGEAFSVAALRTAYRHATRTEDREHVSPWIRRNRMSATYRPQRSDDSDYSYLRCTIDDEEDYQRVVRLFETIPDPVHAGWKDLLQRLIELPGQPAFGIPYRIVAGRPHSKLTLGTAQLGMEYGAVNDAGQPPVDEAVAMMRKAIASGVTAIDTASSYGTAERVLGAGLKGSWASRVQVITKLDLSGLTAHATENEVRREVDNKVRSSCSLLGVPQLGVLLLHRWTDHDSWNGAAWRSLLSLRDAGKISVLGASVYQTSEALEALGDPEVQHLQLPMNVFDWRWEADGIDRAIASRSDVVVHARSALLQGILAHPATRWPKIEGFAAQENCELLARFAAEFGRESVTDLCLAYVRSLPWVTSVVVGCETMGQLEENLRLFRTPELTSEQCGRLRREIPQAPEGFLNPAKWKTIHEASTAR